MIDAQIVKIKTSILENSTGGFIHRTLNQENENSVFFYFSEDESFFRSRKYKFFYLVNKTTNEYEISKIKLSLSLDYSQLQDKFNINFGSNVNFNIFNTSFFQKNIYHLNYNQYGDVLDYKRNIQDYIIEEKKELIIRTNLKFSDFLPFGVYVEIINPVERIVKLPLVLSTKVYIL